MSKRRPSVGDVVMITKDPLIFHACIGIITIRQERVPFDRKGYEIYLGPHQTLWAYHDQFEVIDHDEDLLKEPPVESVWERIRSHSEKNIKRNNPSVTFQETPSGDVRRISPKPETQTADLPRIGDCGQEKLPWPYNATLSQAQPLEVRESPVWIDGRFVTIHTYPRESLIKVNCLGCGKTIKTFKLDLYTEDPRINDCVEISKMRSRNETH